MRFSTIPAALAAFAFASLAHAQDKELPTIGVPHDAGVAFQPAVTPVAESIQWMDDFLLIVITAITLFVVGLMAYVVFRFNEKANPEPADFSHNSLVEVIWTAVPVVILIVIAIPSLKLLFLQLDVPEPDLTIKATGYQWYWGYEYPDQEISFESYMVGSGFATWEDLEASDEGKELIEGGLTRDTWLLQTDTSVVVPVGATVHVLVTGADVIHNWMIPSFGSKIDAVPGRINETWFRAEQEGIYYGQCSELCGMHHAYMPITVEVVSQEAYDAWVGEQQAKARGETEVATAAE